MMNPAYLNEIKADLAALARRTLEALDERVREQDSALPAAPPPLSRSSTLAARRSQRRDVGRPEDRPRGTDRTAPP